MPIHSGADSGAEMRIMKNRTTHRLFAIVRFAALGLMLSTSVLYADENDLVIQPINKQVYALVGKLGPMSDDDLGTNATFGVIVTSASVIVIDPGASFKGAKRVHDKIKEITDKPVKYVINTGSEDQRWLGNGYFKQQGAKILALKAAVKNQQERVNELLTRLEVLLKKNGVAGTQPIYADQVFDKELTLTIDGTKIILRHLGTAYTPGDIIVWLPDQRILISGDIISVERMPAIGPMSNTKSWIEAIQQIVALQPRHIIPGHGHVTTVEQAQHGNLAYLQQLRKGVSALIENGGGLEDVSKVDQSDFKKLIGFEMLKGRNANQVYQELEWQ